MKKILFLLKDRHYSPAKGSYGLLNSASQVAAYLTEKLNVCQITTVKDSNGIDKVLHEFNPDIVIIEALWVTADKLQELMNIHRYMHIKWVVRVHSDMGYLSTEGNGIRTLNDYIDLGALNLTISMNNSGFNKALSNALGFRFIYLPNIITYHEPFEDYTREKSRIHIGCFGALRLLKNQPFQAICAIEAANRMDKKLMFHITPNTPTDRDTVYENIREIFKNTQHELIIHPWMDTKKFHKLISKMDLGLQLSYTESFNIVTADFVSKNKLIIVSQCIDWMPDILKTSTTNYEDVVKKIIYVYGKRNDHLLKELTRRHLFDYNIVAKKKWDSFLVTLEHHHHHHHGPSIDFHDGLRERER
jgi:hypothetical protein